ncbi:MAG: flagellar biosynthesis protein FlhF [Planctomycetes bacterium]|nr:flagellar biosynthesis protein FlhF [Planctomycetota bacterium]
MKLKRKSSPSNIRIFEASTIFEAYGKLKNELGDNAVILSTRTIKKGGILGFWGQKVVQISASDSVSNVPRRVVSRETALPSPAPAYEEDSYVPGAVANASAAVALSSASAPPAVAVPAARGSEIGQELAEIRRMIEDIQEAGRYRHWPELPLEFQKAYEKLQAFNIHEDISRALIHRWRGHYPDYKKGMKVDVSLLRHYIGEMLVPAGPINFKENRPGPMKVMLVGPTGVGKTTSLAKLAARYKIKENKDVALITIDTYRIAAVEQLRTYADLIGVPLKVVSSPSDMAAALDFYKDKELVLIDTAGRSPRNTNRMNDLNEFVKVTNPDELHLVLSISVNNDVLKDTMERYASFPVNKLLLTKLDESVHYGIILSIISKTQKPIGYLTVGQEVPDDIEVASADRLSRLILNLDKIGG